MSVIVRFLLTMIIYAGKCNVHLTGYLDPEFDEEPSDAEEEDEDEEEIPTLVPAKGKRKLENSNNASGSKKKVGFIVLSVY